MRKGKRERAAIRQTAMLKAEIARRAALAGEAVNMRSSTSIIMPVGKPSPNWAWSNREHMSTLMRPRNRRLIVAKLSQGTVTRLF